MPQADQSAPFVVIRLLGACLALTGGSLAGLGLSGTWCAPSAAKATLLTGFAGAAAVVGVLLFSHAWSPRSAGRVMLGGLLVAALVTPFAAHHARQGELDKAEATRQALRSLSSAVEAHRLATGRLPGRSGTAEELVRALGQEEALETRDGWGGELLYELEGDRYRLVARCRCSMPDDFEGHVHFGPPVVGPRADMILEDGELRPWPGDPAR